MTQTRANEEVLIDDFGRMKVIQDKDFWTYVSKKRMTKEEIIKLTADKREQFFLKWKHGMTEHNTNLEFEYSLKVFLKTYEGQPLDAVDPYFRESLRLKRQFEEYCNTIKGEIGLWVRKSDMPKEVQEAADKVGGEVVQYQQ